MEQNPREHVESVIASSRYVLVIGLLGISIMENPVLVEFEEYGKDLFRFALWGLAADVQVGLKNGTGTKFCVASCERMEFLMSGSDFAKRVVPSSAAAWKEAIRFLDNVRRLNVRALHGLTKVAGINDFDGLFDDEN